MLFGKIKRMVRVKMFIQYTDFSCLISWLSFVDGQLNNQMDDTHKHKKIENDY